jgi:hypothetical protein
MEGIKLDKVTFEFIQEEHCMSNDRDGFETLTIECMSDMGISDTDGAFFVLKTEQWAIDGTEDIAKLLMKVKQAIDIVK